MRRRLVFGLGLAGFLSGPALGQFPAAQPPGALPAMPGSPGGVRPAAGTLPPPAGGLPTGFPSAGGAPQPARPAPPVDDEIRTAIPPDHPWRLTPEHGAYFIVVKSYSRPSPRRGRSTPEDGGPTACELAQALAEEIRDQRRVQTFLFEYVSEERKAEIAAIRAARERGRLFANQMEKYRREAALKGMEFLEPDNHTRYKTVNYREQVAVLVGGFQTEDDARKALEKVKNWPAPVKKVKDASLMDYGSVVRPGPDGKPLLQQSHINPFPTASVVPNPTVEREAPPPAAGLDEYIVKLNEGRPYNLLKATKAWTLGVKTFNAPVQIVSGDGAASAMRRPGASKTEDVLVATAEQAEELAKALREIKGPGGQRLEAFVLHNRYGSIVTVGQFEGPNDPALVQTRDFLTRMSARVTEDQQGFRPVMNAPALFAKTILPIPIPKP